MKEVACCQRVSERADSSSMSSGPLTYTVDMVEEAELRRLEGWCEGCETGVNAASPSCAPGCSGWFWQRSAIPQSCLRTRQTSQLLGTLAQLRFQAHKLRSAGTDQLAMASFAVPKSPGGPSAFGGSSKRFERLPASRLAYASKDSFNAPGPGAYSPEEVLGFDHSNLSGVTGSFSREQPFMSGRFSYTASTKSLNSTMQEEPVRPSELATMPAAIGQQPSSRKPNAYAYSMGVSRKGLGRGDAVNRAKTPGALDYVKPSVANPRSALMGTDDRFGDSGTDTSPTRRYAHTPPPTLYDHHHAFKAAAIAPSASYTFGHRPERKVHERSPGPHVAGSPSLAKLSVMRSLPSITIGLKEGEKRTDRRRAATPGVAQYDARTVYWSGNRALGKSPSDLTPLPTRPSRDLNIHKDVQASQG